MRRRIYISTLGLLLSAVMLLTCTSKLKHAAWDSQLLLPIATTKLTIYNLFPDSVLSTDTSHLVSLVFRNSLYSYNKLNSVVRIPDTTVQYDVKVDSLHLANKALTYSYSLGQFAQGAGLTGLFIIASNKTNQAIPAISNTSSSPFPIDATSFFQTATLSAGKMNLSITNNFPIAFTNVVFALTNQNNGTTIIRDTIANLPVGFTFNKIYDLSNKTIDGNMQGQIINMSSPGTGNGTVYIDTTDDMVINMDVYNMQVKQATAVFPAQNLVTDNSNAPYAITGGVKMKNVILREGYLTIKAISTVLDTLHFHYTLPFVTDSLGHDIDINDFVPPSATGHNQSITRNYNLAGYKVDLTGVNHDTVNTFYHTLTLRIDSTGIVRTLSLNDSLYIYYSLHGLTPRYMVGNLGSDTVQFSGSAPFSFLKGTKPGALSVKNVNVDINFTNYIGANGTIKVGSITGKNASGTTMKLTSSALNNPIILGRATNSSTQPLNYAQLVPATYDIYLNNSNSNITQVFNLMPDSIDYTLTTILNPHNNPKSLTDFIYDDHGLNVNMDAKIPLSVMANNLILQDTVAANLSTLAYQAANSNGVTGATINLILNNGFPLSANMQVYFYSSTNVLVDSLFSSTATVQAAPTNNNCVVTTSKQTVLSVPLPLSKLKQLNEATKAVVKSTFNTVGTGACKGQPLNIYSYYTLNVALTAKLNYHFAHQ